MLAIVCPGQGSQTPGFLEPWMGLEAFRYRMQTLSEVAGIDLVAHGTTSDAETIKDTAIAQPLIVASGLAAAAALFDGVAGPGFSSVGATAGHSVGEITAAAFAGVLPDQDAMVFVRERGLAMAAASAVTPTGMSAVLGGDPAEVAAALDQHGLTPANNNGGGQIVAAGTLEQLAGLAAAPPAKARVVPLQVAGAFHTHHMAPAVHTLAKLVQGFGEHDVSDPGVTLLSNADGRQVSSGQEVVDTLVNQVSNPVRWDLCMETLQDLGVTAMIELPPAGTLVGLAKRGMKGVATLALKTPDDLEAAQNLMAEHRQTTSTSTSSSTSTSPASPNPLHSQEA